MTDAYELADALTYGYGGPRVWTTERLCREAAAMLRKQADEIGRFRAENAALRERLEEADCYGRPAKEQLEFYVDKLRGVHDFLPQPFQEIVERFIGDTDAALLAGTIRKMGDTHE